MSGSSLASLIAAAADAGCVDHTSNTSPIHRARSVRAEPYPIGSASLTSRESPMCGRRAARRRTASVLAGQTRAAAGYCYPPLWSGASMSTTAGSTSIAPRPRSKTRGTPTRQRRRRRLPRRARCVLLPRQPALVDRKLGTYTATAQPQGHSHASGQPGPNADRAPVLVTRGRADGGGRHLDYRGALGVDLGAEEDGE
jgi:hypothetical protein